MVRLIACESRPLIVGQSSTMRSTSGGWRSASVRPIMPPIECPISTTGPSLSCSMSAARNSAYCGMLARPGSGGDLPKPGKSTIRQRKRCASRFASGASAYDELDQP